MEDYILSGSFQIGIGNSFSFDFQIVIDSGMDCGAKVFFSNSGGLSGMGCTGMMLEDLSRYTTMDFCSSGI